jgi:DNA-binding SARP family transcriptional activator
MSKQTRTVTPIGKSISMPRRSLPGEPSTTTTPNAGGNLEQSITVRTLGAFEVTAGGVAVKRWRASKACHLLQYMLLRRGRHLSRDQLNDALWPESAWSSGSSSLKVAAHVLRRVLAEHGADSDGVSSLRLITTDNGYRLSAENVLVDFESFNELVDHGYALQREGDNTGALRLYQKAAELYQGDFLSDVHLPWATEYREWLRSRLLCTLEFIIESQLRDEDFQGAVSSCMRILEVDPLNEKVYRSLMVLHGLLGQLNQTIRWYRLCEVRLRDELQVEPDRRTRQLYQRAMLGQLTHEHLAVAI